MAQITETVCDRDGCGRINAQPFTLFKHHKTDNTDNVFDLCPTCCVLMLEKVFSVMTPELGEELLTTFRIKARLK